MGYPDLPTGQKKLFEHITPEDFAKEEFWIKIQKDLAKRDLPSTDGVRIWQAGLAIYDLNAGNSF